MKSKILGAASALASGTGAFLLLLQSGCRKKSRCGSEKPGATMKPQT